jgi:SAM-dependent methyltransferase
MKPGSYFDTIYETHPEGWGFSERQSQLFRYRIYLDMISRIQPLPLRALDVGCGEGYLSSRLRQAFGLDVVGMDVSKVAIGRARQKYPDIEFAECSATAIPWDTLTPRLPDLVLLGEVLYYMDENEQRTCVDDIRRRVPEGTHVLVSVNLGAAPYFSPAGLDNLFAGFRRVEYRGIYLRTYHRLVESRLWSLRCRFGGLAGRAIAGSLKLAPIRAIDGISRLWPDTEESIRVAMFRKESL